MVQCQYSVEFQRIVNLWGQVVVGHFPVHTFSHILEMRSSSKATCKMSPLLVQQQWNSYLIMKLHAIFKCFKCTSIFNFARAHSLYEAPIAKIIVQLARGPRCTVHASWMRILATGTSYNMNRCQILSILKVAKTNFKAILIRSDYNLI